MTTSLSLREAAEEAPDTVLTARQHTNLIANVERFGAVCVECDAIASPTETDAYLADIRHDPEPAPWTCGCTDLPAAEPVRRSAKVTLTGNRADVITLTGRYTAVRERLEADWTVRVRAGANAPERCDHGIVADPYMRLLGLTSGRQWLPPAAFEAVAAALVAWASLDNSADAPAGGDA